MTRPPRLWLPFAYTTPARPFLVDGEAPVWPVCDDAEASLLATVTAAFGARAVEVAAGPGRPAADRRRGVVVGLGGDVEPCGRLYAHLTRRPYATAAGERVASRRGQGELHSLGRREPLDPAGARPPRVAHGRRARV